MQLLADPPCPGSFVLSTNQPGTAVSLAGENTYMVCAHCSVLWIRWLFNIISHKLLWRKVRRMGASNMNWWSQPLSGHCLGWSCNDSCSALTEPLSLLCHCRLLIYFKNKLACVERRLPQVCRSMRVFLPLPPSQDQAKGAGGISVRIPLWAAPWSWHQEKLCSGQGSQELSCHTVCNKIQDKTTWKMSQLLENLQPDQLSFPVHEDTQICRK